MLLVLPYHPSFAEKGILIQAHPQQSQRTLERGTFVVASFTATVSDLI